MPLSPVIQMSQKFTPKNEISMRNNQNQMVSAQKQTRLEPINMTPLSNHQDIAKKSHYLTMSEPREFLPNADPYTSSGRPMSRERGICSPQPSTISKFTRSKMPNLNAIQPLNLEFWRNNINKTTRKSQMNQYAAQQLDQDQKLLTIFSSYQDNANQNVILEKILSPGKRNNNGGLRNRKAQARKDKIYTFDRRQELPKPQQMFME